MGYEVVTGHEGNIRSGNGGRPVTSADAVAKLSWGRELGRTKRKDANNVTCGTADEQIQDCEGRVVVR